MRDSGHDPCLREFYITDKGLHVGEAFPVSRESRPVLPASLQAPPLVLRPLLPTSDARTSPAVQTILVVDDELGAIEVVATALEDEGYRVLSAANGRHGLEKLSEGQVDLAVIDFMMPLVDGAAMARPNECRTPPSRKYPSS